MAQKILTFTLKANESANWTAKAQANGSYQADSTTKAQLYTVRGPISWQSGATHSVTLAENKTLTMPAFESITSATVSVTGSPSHAYLENVYSGATITVTSGGTLNAANIEKIAAIGSGGSIKAIADKNVSVSAPTASTVVGTDVGSWSPQTQSGSFTVGEGFTDTVTRNVTVSGVASMNVTITLTINYIEESSEGGDSGESGGTDTPDTPIIPDSSGVIFNIEPHGVAIGKYAEGTEANPLFEVNMSSNFNTKVTMMNVEMSDGWHDLTLASGVTASTTNCGRVGGGAKYKIEGQHHVYIALNVNFTAAKDKLLATIPSDYAPPHTISCLGTTIWNTGDTLFIKATADGKITCERSYKGGVTQTTTNYTYTDIYFDYFI